MRLLHSAARTNAAFDAENVVSLAGLVPVMRLAQEAIPPTRVLAEILAGMPDVIGRLIVEHLPDEHGRCRGCTSPGTGRPNVPVAVVAAQARRRGWAASCRAADARRRRDQSLGPRWRGC